MIEEHAYLQEWCVGGSYGIGGSRGCMRSCMNYLEKRGLVEQIFNGGDFIRRPRWLLDAEGNIAEDLSCEPPPEA